MCAYLCVCVHMHTHIHTCSDMSPPHVHTAHYSCAKQRVFQHLRARCPVLCTAVIPGTCLCAMPSGWRGHHQEQTLPYTPGGERRGGEGVCRALRGPLSAQYLSTRRPTSRDSCKLDGDVTYSVCVPAANPVCPHRSTRRAPNDCRWFLSLSPASSPASVADTDQRADTMLCAL